MGSSTMFLLLDIIGLVAIILLFILLLKKYRKYSNLIKQHLETQEKHGRYNGYSIESKKSAVVYSGYRVESEKSAVISMESLSQSQLRAIVRIDGDKRKLIFVDDEDEPFLELNDLLKAPAAGLGNGIFGNAYKVTMEGRPSIVVKRLRDLKPLSNEEFRRKLNVIAELKHPNLLRLLAYYNSNDEKLLIHRYAEKGSLYSLIHEGRGAAHRIPFRWRARLSAARGVARALEFLHSSYRTQHLNLPHGNLKSSNALIDKNDVVLVSDYGLDSIVAHPIASQQMVAYKSPEYKTTKTVSKASDVWSYGCLVLELLTGKEASHSVSPGSKTHDLCSWIQRAIREEWTAELLDTELLFNRSSVAEMLKLLRIAIRCCDKSPEQRPRMTEVLREVENVKIVESGDEDDLSVDQSMTDESTSVSISAAGKW